METSEKSSTSSLDKAINDLYEWLKQQDFASLETSPLKLILSENKSEGRCVIATKNVKANTDLIEVPARLLINHRLAFANEHLLHFFAHQASQTHSNEYKLSRLDALYLFLVAEKLDEQSRTHKFINTMPVTYDTPEYFDAELITCLPRCLREDINARLHKLNHKYECIRGLLDAYEKEAKTIDSLKQRMNFEAFRLIFCMYL